MNEPPQGVVFNIERYMVYDGPGIRTVVFLKGCPLRCLWCDNPESQRPGPELMRFADKCIGCKRCLWRCSTGALHVNEEGGIALHRSLCTACGDCVLACPSEALVMSGRVMTADQVVAEVLADEPFYRRSGGGVTLGGGEPTAQPAFAAEILRQCRERGLHTAIETCGDASWEALERVLRHTQLVLLDLKHLDPTEHVRLTGRSNARILANTRRIIALAGEGAFDVIVRRTCVPGYNDAPDSLAETARFLAGSAVKRLELVRYHELGTPKYAVLGRRYPLGTLQADEAHLQALASLVRSLGVLCEVL